METILAQIKNISETYYRDAVVMCNLLNKKNDTDYDGTANMFYHVLNTIYFSYIDIKIKRKLYRLLKNLAIITLNNDYYKNLRNNDAIEDDTIYYFEVVPRELLGMKGTLTPYNEIFIRHSDYVPDITLYTF